MKKKFNLKLSRPKIIGLVLMGFAFITMIVAVPVTDYINRSGEVTIVVATQDLTENTVITASMVKEVQMPKSELVTQFTLSLEEIIGKYTSSFVLADEPFSRKRISTTPVYKDYFLHELPKDKKAISVTLANMAASVSGKIQPNDIVTVFACPPNNESGNMAIQSQELMYVKVLDVVTNEGASLADGSEAAAPQLSTVTLLADTRQASILAYYDRMAPVHLAVAYRGEPEQSNKLLQQQEDILKKIVITEESEAEQ